MCQPLTQKICQPLTCCEKIKYTNSAQKNVAKFIKIIKYDNIC